MLIDRMFSQPPSALLSLRRHSINFLQITLWVMTAGLASQELGRGQELPCLLSDSGPAVVGRPIGCDPTWLIIVCRTMWAYVCVCVCVVRKSSHNPVRDLRPHVVKQCMSSCSLPVMWPASDPRGETVDLRRSSCNFFFFLTLLFYPVLYEICLKTKPTTW